MSQDKEKTERRMHSGSQETFIERKEQVDKKSTLGRPHLYVDIIARGSAERGDNAVHSEATPRLLEELSYAAISKPRKLLLSMVGWTMATASEGGELVIRWC